MACPASTSSPSEISRLEAAGMEYSLCSSSVHVMVIDPFSMLTTPELRA